MRFDRLRHGVWSQSAQAGRHGRLGVNSSPMVAEGRSYVGKWAAVNLSATAGTLLAMNVDVWLPPVLAAIIGALLSPSAAKGLLTLAAARARRVKHIPITGAGLYANGVPLDEAQFRAVFAAY